VRQKPVRAYLERELADALSRRARAQGRSESSLIAEAVRARLAATSNQVLRAENETARRQLGRIEARLDKLIWEQLQIKECVFLFIRVWLEHNPPLEEGIEESAAISAEARFERFLDLLAEALASCGAQTDLDARIGVSAPNGAPEDAASEEAPS
jgi:hypothetical protein